jgi:uncharacterized protein
VRLVDHHCHGVVLDDLDRAGFEAYLSEGGPPAPGETNFDTPAGLAVRRHCAPVLNLPVHASASSYLERRAELGGVEVARRLLASTGTSAYLVDTGHNPAALTSPARLAEVGGGTARHIVRLESVAESLFPGDPGSFSSAFTERLAATVASVRAVGVKSVAAYRTGFRIDPARPGETEVARAVEAWQRTGVARPADPVLTRFLWWTAVDLGLPIQLHVGFGDQDIRMTEVDPTLLTDWLKLHRVPVMLLHCWPFHRQASYLACVYPNVYLDVGLTLPFVGPRRGIAVLAEAAELTPFTRLLYSSDAYALPELYHLAALTFRGALSALVDDRVSTGEWAAADGERFASMVAHGNAERVYGL